MHSKLLLMRFLLKCVWNKFDEKKNPCQLDRIFRILELSYGRLGRDTSFSYKVSSRYDPNPKKDDPNT